MSDADRDETVDTPSGDAPPPDARSDGRPEADDEPDGAEAGPSAEAVPTPSLLVGEAPMGVVRGRRRSTALTERQRAILEMIHAHHNEHGYPPSVREIGEAVGLRSPSSVHSQLEVLEDKGYLRRDPTKPRALELGRDPDTMLEIRPAPARNVPVVGEIAAGGPILAEERVDAVYPMPKDLVGDGQLFMLRIRGESMIDAGVLDGDLVVVREQPSVEQGEMCAALIDGEATVKFFRRTRDGEVFLDPANESFDPIPVHSDQDATIMGKVVTVMRAVR